MQISLGLFIGVAVALALIVGIITHFVTVSNLRKNAESKIGNAEAKAREIIDDAVKTAETTKKESLLEVKEELNGRDNMEHSGDGFSFYYEEYRYH